MGNELKLGTFESTTGIDITRLSIGDQSIDCTAAEVEKLIAHLSQARAQMRPQVQGEDFRFAGLKDIPYDPRIEWGYDPLIDQAALAIRHPGMGWIPMALSIEMTQTLIDGLSAVMDARVPPNQTRQ